MHIKTSFYGSQGQPADSIGKEAVPETGIPFFGGVPYWGRLLLKFY